MDYEGIEGAKKINRIMDFFRNLENPFIAGEEIEIKNDFETSLTTNLKDSTKIIIDLPKSNVLGFEFKSGNRLFLRPSGTEPKIKFYTMVRQNDGDLKHKKDQAIKRVVEIETYIKQCCEKI
jgi:phosphoglucomutase